jgi:integrase
VKTRTEKRAAGAIKPDSATVKGKIIEFAWKLKKHGYSKYTIHHYVTFLEILLKRGANLFEPESVKDVIAKREGVSNGTKLMYSCAYAAFAKNFGIHFDKPKYRQEETLPFIPTEAEIDALIAGSNPKLAAVLQLIKETGMRIGEALRVKWIDLDLEHNTLTLNAPEKRGKPRKFKISNKLAAMLQRLPRKNELIFSGRTRSSVKLNLYQTRKRLAAKLQNPRLLRVRFHTLRHWKATMEYHRTKDILYVKELLGHRTLNTTLKYTQLANFETPDQYHSATAKTLDEAEKLIQAGFEYVTTYNNIMLFRKPK